MNSASIQSPKIPVLGPYEAQCFSKYFKGIDSLLAKRFLFGFLPNEEHITSILCELLDERGSQLHQLPYSLLDLNNDLKKNGVFYMLMFLYQQLITISARSMI